MNKANQLCLDCGMCCDGTLFKDAVVDLEDKEQVQSTGLTVNENLGKFSFEQPCKFYCNNQCSIYAQCPTVCKAYRCHLLVKLDENEISLENALERVKMVRALQKDLLKFIPHAKHSPITSAEVFEVARAIDQQGPLQRKQHSMFLLLAAKFIGQLSEHFSGKEKMTNPSKGNSDCFFQNRGDQI